MRRVCTLCSIAALLEVTPQAADGQSQGRGLSKLWIGDGLGLSSVGLSISGNATAEVSGWLVSLRGTANLHAGIFTSGDKLFDVGILVGTVLHEPTSTGARLVTVAAGLGPVWRSVALEPDQAVTDFEKRRTIGIPIEMQVCGTLLPTGRGIGMCAYGFLNLNPERPFGGVTASVFLGKLR